MVENNDETITITIYAPAKLAKELDRMAEEDNRTRSNFIVNVLQGFVEEKKR